MKSRGGARCVRDTLAAIAIGAASASATGDILDFESLPYPTYFPASTGGMVSDPLASHMGFRFSSENFFPPGSSSLFANVWLDYALTDTPYYENGYPYGINGERALGVPMYDPWNPCTFSIEREDGGEWMFGGAQFSPVSLQLNDTVFRIAGWRDGVEVYNIGTHLIQQQQLFVGSTLSAIAVDRVVMTYRRVPPPSGVLSRWFTMDDMHYELVPAPGALVLLGVCGLMRRRQRS